MKNRSASEGALFALNGAIMIQHGVLLLLVGPIVPNLMETFGIDEGTTGLLLAMGSFGFLSGPLIAGAIIDRIHIRWAVIFGLCIEAVFLLLFGWSRLFLVAIIANFFLHMGASFVETGGNVMPTLIPGKRSAHSKMNMVHLFFSIGAFVGPFLVGLYLNTFGAWRPLFILALLPTGALFLWTMAARFPDRAPRAAEHSGQLQDLVAVLGNGTAVWGSLTLLLYVGAEVGVSSWIVHYLQKVLGFDTVSSTAGLSLLWVFMMVGRYTNGLLGRKVSAKSLVVVSGIAGTAAVMGFIFVTDLVPVYLLIAVMGICLSGVFPNVMAELNSRDPARAGTVTAVMAMGAALGAGIFQWLVGIIAEIASLRIAFIVPAVLQGLTVITFMAALRTGNAIRSIRTRR